MLAQSLGSLLDKRYDANARLALLDSEEGWSRDLWKQYADQSFNERQRAMIDRLLGGFEGKLTSSKWAQLTKCSQDTALRDIDDLIAKQALSKDAPGGRSTSYSLTCH